MPQEPVRNWKTSGTCFDNAVGERIAADQELGLTEAFAPRLIAEALNRVDASLYIQAFGQRPRSQPGPVLDAIARVSISVLYGQESVSSKVPTLIREQNARSTRTN